MSKFLALVLMIFCHIVDDYYLQGILAKMKQRDWWKDKVPDKRYEKYKYDYIVALICHSLSWGFMIMLPIFIITSWNPAWWVYFVWFWNCLIHGVVDDFKANRKKLNLIQDQIIHFVQILVTWFVCVVI